MEITIKDKEESLLPQNKKALEETVAKEEKENINEEKQKLKNTDNESSPSKSKEKIIEKLCSCNNEIKNNFIFKVLILIFCRLIVCFFILVCTFKIQNLKEVVKNSHKLLGLCGTVVAGSFGGVLLYVKILSIDPINYIYLFLNNIATSFLISKCALFFTDRTIMIFCSLVLFTMICLLIVSSNTKNESMNFLGKNIIILLALMLWAMIIIFGCNFKFFYALLMVICIMILMNYVLYDLTKIIEDESYLRNDYVKATIFLFIDVFILIYQNINKLIEIIKESDPEAAAGFEQLRDIIGKQYDDVEKNIKEEENSKKKKGGKKDKKKKDQKKKGKKK